MSQVRPLVPPFNKILRLRHGLSSPTTLLLEVLFVTETILSSGGHNVVRRKLSKFCVYWSYRSNLIFEKVTLPNRNLVLTEILS